VSHPSAWLCKACGMPLGEVDSEGSLTVRRLEVRSGRRGPTRVVCPSCDAERPWLTGRSPFAAGENLGKANCGNHRLEGGNAGADPDRPAGERP
jgi:hypothetical protein